MPVLITFFCVADEFAAQESQKPDNLDKNRYPNIIACKYKNKTKLHEMYNVQVSEYFRKERPFLS
jgi:hypothetical protein